jgi:hypothetical protein
VSARRVRELFEFLFGVLFALSFSSVCGDRTLCERVWGRFAIFSTKTLCVTDVTENMLADSSVSRAIQCERRKIAYPREILEDRPFAI